MEAVIAEIVFLVEEAPEGGFTAKALDNSIYTEADTWDELKIAIQNAITYHFDEGLKPKVVRLRYLKEEGIAT